MFRKLLKFLAWTVAIVILLPLGVLALRLAVGPMKQDKSEPTVEDAQGGIEEAQFQLYSLTLRRLVASMKNPDSFVLVDAVKMKEGNLCITYKGTNSFNAVVTEFAIIDDDMAVHTDRKSWKKRCSGKTGERYTHIKYNL